jgi:hypothetical protein
MRNRVRNHIAEIDRTTAARFVKIRFSDKPSRVAGVYGLMRQTRVVCLPNDEYVIARAGLAILEGSEIPYEVLEETSLDQTLAALRDSAAPLL